MLINNNYIVTQINKLSNNKIHKKIKILELFNQIILSINNIKNFLNKNNWTDCKYNNNNSNSSNNNNWLN